MELKSLFGMRILKTGLAVALSATLGMTPLVVSPFFTVIATVLALQNTVKSSFDASQSRLLGTVLGASVGFVFAFAGIAVPLPFQPLLLAVALMVCIIACTRLKLGSALAITVTVCTSLVVGIESGDLDLMGATIFRTSDTIMGILVSLGVNYFIKPPNYWGEMSFEIKSIEGQSMKMLRDILLSKPFSLDGLKQEIRKLDQAHSRVLADRKFQKNPVSTANAQAVVDACHELLFHFKSIHKLSDANPSLSLIAEKGQLQIFRMFYSPKAIDLEKAGTVLEFHIYQIIAQIRLTHKLLGQIEEKVTKSQ
ncbi:MAG: aromatic acid exporter family protein [Turicibacter sp.]|nr:aromatic acid exporter family protein [Turicibacter sp.]